MKNKPPKIFKWICEKLQSSYCPTCDDLAEEFEFLIDEIGLKKAKAWYRWQVVKSFPHSIIHKIIWSFVMIKNYLKITLRNIKRHKGYHFLNIAGLAIGMACFIFILLYVQFELSYDNFHNNADRIFRIANEQVTASGNRYYSAVTPVMGPAVKENFPEVEKMVRLIRSEPKTLKYGNRMYLEDKIVFSEPEIFDIFSIQFIKGDPQNALNRPLTTIITESIATKYFGDEDPIGKFLQSEGINFEVTGVITDSPKNTHYKFGLIGSLITLIQSGGDVPPGFYTEWSTGAHAAHTYIKLIPNTNLSDFETKVNQLAYENIKENLAQSGYEHHYFLQKLREIHLKSNLRGEAETPGNIQYLTIFSIVGILILLIACINFMNLSTARAANRSCEVGMRKVVGAARRQLITQFIGESICITLITFVFSLLLIGLIMPYFNELLGTQFNFSELFQTKILMILVVLVLLTGTISGSYPAFFLSAFQPSSMLKRTLSSGKKGTLVRKILVTGQIVISIILIIGALVIFKQINFMKNAPLGFDKKQKLIINLPNESMMTNNYTTIKSEFLKHPSVLGISASSNIPGRRTYFWRMWPSGMRDQKSQPLNFLNVDYDFLKIYDMEIIAGKAYDRSLGSDLEAPGWIINEEAVKAYGWDSPEDALGKEMMEDRTPIVGVVKNFHFKGLQNVVEPLGMSVWSDHFRCFTLKVDLSNLDETLAFAERTFNQFFPGELFDYFFLDDDFNRHYQFEEKISAVFSIFTFLGIAIAVLGLFGLSAFIAEQRTREIGIRKVFGATVFEMVYNLLKDFGKWILIATFIAWPLAWYVANNWLQNFAYRTSLGIELFILSGLIAMVIVLVATCYQIIKAATANPIDSLRYE